MGKIILFVVLALVVYLVIKGASRARRRPARDKSPERMVACGRCGVNLPESEAIQEGGRHYCSEDHRREGAA